MKRGELVSVVLPGDYGKPRPAVVVQSNRFTASGIPSIIVCPLTSDLTQTNAFRIAVAPSKYNGLKLPSHIMADKIMALPKNRLGSAIGKMEERHLEELSQMLAFILGLAD